MSKSVKAVLTIIAGTVGVGFLALPYSIYKFGTIGGVILLVIAGILTLVTNITYSDIITTDRGNRQVPGYIKKYLGAIPAHIMTVIIILGSVGILLAYGLISGQALSVIFSQLGIDLSANFLGLAFVIASLVVMRYGMQIISKVSSWSVIVLIIAMSVVLIIAIPNVSFDNASKLDFSQFPILFGVSIFALSSAASIPAIDELIGYKKKQYRKVIVAATIITLAMYIIFSLVISLSFEESLTSELVDSFTVKFPGASIILSLLTLLATFTSFVLAANSTKEVLNYDYKVPAKTSTLLISAALIWSLILDFASFESLISVVGKVSLTLQSIALFAVWFRSQKKASLISRIIVAVCGGVIVIGMVI
jgi:amino acid permease